MYGTVARMRVKAGAEDQLLCVLLDIAQRAIPGFVRAAVHRMEADPRQLVFTLAFESKAAYEAHTASPEQDARACQMLALVEGEPEWRDGPIIQAEP